MGASTHVSCGCGCDAPLAEGPASPSQQRSGRAAPGRLGQSCWEETHCGQPPPCIPPPPCLREHGMHQRALGHRVDFEGLGSKHQTDTTGGGEKGHLHR